MKVFDAIVPKLAGGFFLLIGCLVAVWGVVWLGKTIIFVNQAARAPGTIVEMERSDFSKGSSVYYPIFTFVDSSGATHTQKASVGSSTYTFEPGERVSVLYDKAAPKHSEIDSFGTIWTAPLLVTVFGVVFGGFSFLWTFIAVWAIRSKSERQRAERDAAASS